MKHLSTCFGVHPFIVKQLGAKFSQLLHPWTVFFAKTFFEFLAQSLRQSRTLPRSRDCDLERAALNYCGGIAVAVWNIVDRVAENLSRFRLFKNLSIRLGVGNRYDQESVRQVPSQVRPRLPAQLTFSGPFCDLRGDIRSNEPDFCLRFEKIANLALSHLVSADHDAISALQIEKKRIE